MRNAIYVKIFKIASGKLSVFFLIFVVKHGSSIFSVFHSNFARFPLINHYRTAAEIGRMHSDITL